MRINNALVWAALALVALRADAIESVVEYLSDRPEDILAATQDWGELGYDAAAHQPRIAGEPLRIADHNYAKGLGHHANGRLVVLLGGEFSALEAEVGLQPAAGTGSVIFRVLADGKTLFDSGVMRTGDTAKPVRVSIEGAQELVLEASDAGDGINCDMANWANARLVRLAGTERKVVSESVDVARFAEVVTSDPDRTDGAKADRVHEYRAEDVFLESGLKPNASGAFTVTPNSKGIACVGLKWFCKRPLRELRLRLVDGARMPAADSVIVQGWFGESAWQGRWVGLNGAKSVEGGELVMRLSSKSPEGGLLQTRKVRWLLPTREQTLAVLELKAYSRSRWQHAGVVLEAENPVAGARGQVRVLNGELLTRDDQSPVSAAGWNDWDLSRPLRLKLRHARPSSLKADATVIQVRLPGGELGVGVEDLLAHGCVYVPSGGLFAAVEDTGAAVPNMAEYKRRIAGRKTILEEVRTLPEQTLEQAMAKTHHDAQNEGPVMLSLACDNTKFIVGRHGDTQFQTALAAGDNWQSSAATLEARFGDGKRDRFDRRLDGGWLPIPVITVEREGVSYLERVFVAPADANGPDPGRLNRGSLCAIEFTARNLLDQPRPARIELHFRLPGDSKPVVLERESDTRYSARVGRIEARMLAEDGAALGLAAGPGTLTLEGALPARTSARCVVFLGGKTDRSIELSDLPRLREAVESYWRSVLASATQIETPDEFLNKVIRSSQVRCLIAARNEADGARVAPWIAAMAYGPLESEAHSVIRGMDFLGHGDFARRGLDYFIHRYNTNGFLTTGYTTFGTAWHLWTLGEHCQLTGDTAWLRENAPELRRVGDWILRQIEKTKRTAPDGQLAPEWGLMPPGVMADWNAFACWFMMNGYYHAALRELGSALGGIGDPRSEAFTRGAIELRQSILRAYRWTQAQSPALPLRNGTWIPHHPSQVHSPGKLADFFPGDDAGRSWAYDTELGAHQLVPTGVLEPNDPEVTRILDHMEDVQFLGEGWFDYPAAQNQKDWFNLGGFAKVQPYYGRNAEVCAMRDDVKPFLRSYFNSLASLLNLEVLTLWEHFRHSGAWDKTHETGYFLHQTRSMLVQERGTQLWLAPFVPSSWLRAGQVLSVSNAPSRFGAVSYRVASGVEANRIEVGITPPSRVKPSAIVIRLRHPEGRAIRGVQVNTVEHRQFDPRLETVTLTSWSGSLNIVVHR